MEWTDDFHVALPVEQAWTVLTDLARIVPCMPGAQLQEVAGDEYRGVVKLKVGPMVVRYEGKATFLDRDDAAHVAVLRAEGVEPRGGGSADATITAQLAADGDGTAVSVVTDLTVTGRVGQFGRGVLADVSADLLRQFVACLDETIVAAEPRPAVQDSVANSVVERRAEAPGGGATVEESVIGAVGNGDAAGGRAPVETPVVGKVGDGAGPVVPGPDQPLVRVIESARARPIALAGVAGSSLTKRVGLVLTVVAIVWVLKKVLSRTRR